MKNAANNNRGVTLVELVVVIALIAVLGFVMFPLIQTTFESWRVADRRVELLQQGRIGLGKIIREIRMASDLASATDSAYVDYYPDWASGTQYRFYFSTDTNLIFTDVATISADPLAGPIDSSDYVTYTRRLTTGVTQHRRVDSFRFRFDVSDVRQILPATINPMEFRSFVNMRTSREGFHYSRDLTFASDTYYYDQSNGDNICFKAYCDRVDRSLGVASSATLTCIIGFCAAVPALNLAYVANGDYYAACNAAATYNTNGGWGGAGGPTHRVYITVTDGVETCDFYDAVRIRP